MSVTVNLAKATVVFATAALTACSTPDKAPAHRQGGYTGPLPAQQQQPDALFVNDQQPSAAGDALPEDNQPVQPVSVKPQHVKSTSSSIVLDWWTRRPAEYKFNVCVDGIKCDAYVRERSPSYNGAPENICIPVELEAATWKARGLVTANSLSMYSPVPFAETVVGRPQVIAYANFAPSPHQLEKLLILSAHKGFRMYNNTENPGRPSMPDNYGAMEVQKPRPY